MTLEELLKAWEAAEAALKLDPKNADLKQKALDAKAAYDAKKSESDEDDDDDGADDEDDDDEDDPEDKLKKLTDEEKLKLIKKLRQENAKSRVKGKELASKLKVSESQKKEMLKAAGIEVEDDSDPTEKVKSLTAENQGKDFKLAVLESAVKNGIPGDAVKYFEFLVAQAINELPEDEEFEFSDENEKLQEIIAEVKARKKTGANTSVGGDGKGGKKPPKPGASGEVSLGQFIRMSMMEKDKLYREQPEVYNLLVQEAKSQKKLV